MPTLFCRDPHLLLAGIGGVGITCNAVAVHLCRMCVDAECTSNTQLVLQQV